MSDILNVLKSMIPAEIIDNHDVDQIAEQCVMLDIEFTPVVFERVSDPATTYFDRVPTPRRVQKEGDRYCVWLPDSDQKYAWVNESSLKVMRARYLLLRGYYHSYIERFPHSLQQEIVSKFFPGGLFKPDILKD